MAIFIFIFQAFIISAHKKITLTLVIQTPAYSVAVNPIPAGGPTFIIIEIQGPQPTTFFPGNQIRDSFSLSVTAYHECGIYNIFSNPCYRWTVTPQTSYQAVLTNTPTYPVAQLHANTLPSYPNSGHELANKTVAFSAPSYRELLSQLCQRVAIKSHPAGRI